VLDSLRAGAGFALWETVTVLLRLPAETVTVPTRAVVEVFSATLKVKEPLPVPLVLLNPLIQAADDLIVQPVLHVIVIAVVMPPL
jgi:hypothetical protein